MLDQCAEVKCRTLRCAGVDVVRHVGRGAGRPVQLHSIAVRLAGSQPSYSIGQARSQRGVVDIIEGVVRGESNSTRSSTIGTNAGANDEVHRVVVRRSHEWPDICRTQVGEIDITVENAIHEVLDVVRTPQRGDGVEGLIKVWLSSG